MLRPDLLLTDDGFVMTELDSVPGGIGLTAFLNRLYRESEGLLGADDAIIKNFHASLAALRPGIRNPLIALVVSDEAATYRPEMEWLAHQMQVAGQRVFCMRPEDLFPLGGALFFDVEGNPEKIDVIYRFFELFDLASIKTAPYIFDAWASGDVAIAPPMRTFQEEKLAFALFHHHLLQAYWEEARWRKPLAEAPQVADTAHVGHGPGAASPGRRPGRAQGARPRSWELAGPHRGDAEGARPDHKDQRFPRDRVGRAKRHSRQRQLPGRSGSLGSQSARSTSPRQTSTSCRSTGSPAVGSGQQPFGAEEPHAAVEADGRLRLCPYYFLVEGKARLSGALATFCPPDKKIIHGMTDAALLPTRIRPA